MSSPRLNRFVALTALAASTAISACHSTHLVASWREPGAQPLHFRKAIAVFVTKDEALRRTLEDKMADEFPNTTPSYRVLKSSDIADTTGIEKRLRNLGFEEAVKQLGGELVRAKVGDRYVLEEMLARDIRIGGEQSGHVIFLDDNTTGDGLITAVRLLEAVVSAKEPLSRMAARMTSYPQLLHNLRVGKLAGWQENAAIQNAITSMSAELAGSGRILVRASGTEALLRVMVEGKDQAQIESVAARLDQVIMAELGPAVAAR